MKDYLNNIMEEIITYDGTTALRRNCRFIKGAFYIKNKQCFFIGDKWYRIDSNKVVFDCEKQSWIMKDSTYLIHGIININDDIPEFGDFSANPRNNVKLFCKGKLHTAINTEIFRENRIKEGLTGIYYFENDKIIPKEFTTKLKPRKDGCYSFPFEYSSDNLIPRFVEMHEDFIGKSLLSDASKYIDGFSFGVEFETEKGTIPEKFLGINGLIPLRDGSITGFEYTTIPLKGAMGIQTIKECCILLKKYCSCSPNESLHIHISGYPKTVKAISALYKTSLLLQKEIYSMFPYYYKDTAEFKKKSYCNPLYLVGTELTNAKEIFSQIYMLLSNGNEFTTFPTGSHPMDRSGQHKWEVSPRYYWENLIPLIWGSKNTVEFRCHTPTVQAQKVINWLFILVAIMKYALKHSNSIIITRQAELAKLTLLDVLDEAYPSNIVRILDSYIKERKKHYSNRNDAVGEIEIYSEERDEELFDLKEFV
jgi:hypothetical protein